MVLKFQYQHWYKNDTEIPLPSVKFCIAWLSAPQRSYLRIYLIRPLQVLRHPIGCDCEFEDSVYWAFPYRINRAFTNPTPYLEVSHPHSLSRGRAAWSVLAVWHSEHANYTILGQFSSIFFAITSVYSSCMLLTGFILPLLAVKMLENHIRSCKNDTYPMATFHLWS